MVYIPRITDRDKNTLTKRIDEAGDDYRFTDGADLAAWLEGRVVEEKSDEIDDDREYTHLEMKEFFASIPVWELDLEIAGIEGKAEMASQHPGAKKLRDYWVRGKGALKIRWGVSGDYNRCVKQLSKYVGVRSKGLCNVYHRAATGSAPGKGPHAG